MIYKMANRNSPQCPPLQDQVPNQMRMGIENPRDPDMPESELTPSPVAGQDGSDIIIGLSHRVDVEAPEELANGTNFMMGGHQVSVEKPEITTIFRDLLLIIYGNNCEKRILRHTTMVSQQLRVLLAGFCKLHIDQNLQWAE